MIAFRVFALAVAFAMCICGNDVGIGFSYTARSNASEKRSSVPPGARTTDALLFDNKIPQKFNEFSHFRPDKRWLVGNEIKHHPWAYIAYAEANWGAYDKENERCTAVIIEKNIAITAGHCVYRHRPCRTGFCGLAKQLTLAPGFQNGWAPCGSFTSESIYPTIEFMMNESDLKNDYAFVRFREDIGARCYQNFKYGRLRINYNPVFYLNNIIAIAGYPHVALRQPSKEAWVDQGTVRSEKLQIRGGLLRYVTGASPGQSGSPILLFQNGQWTLVGIHARGAPKYGTANVGPYFGGAIGRDIRSWLAQHGTH